MNWDEINYFTRAEFGQGEPGVEPDPELVKMLDQARYLAGIPFVITSGLRTAEHNSDVGGVEESAHVTGHAVDIRIRSGRERFLILHAAISAGFHRIGVGRTFLHLDNDPTKVEDVIWTYG